MPLRALFQTRAGTRVEPLSWTDKKQNVNDIYDFKYMKNCLHLEGKAQTPLLILKSGLFMSFHIGHIN